MFENDHIRKSCELLREADFVLVAAGAGLSADAGIDYMDTVSFARRFPALVKRGFRMKAELMGYRDWSPEGDLNYAIHHNCRRPPSGSQSDEIPRKASDD